MYLLGISGGTFGVAGKDDYIWSSRSGTVTTAYDFALNAADIIPSNGPWDRWNGRSLRCLSTVLDM